MPNVTYNIGNRGVHNPFRQGGTVQTATHQEITNEAVVIDIIVNDAHSEYAQDGYNVGAIKFRSIKSDMYRDNAQLNWALPLDANITEYPLLNEVVLIYSSLNRFYYTRKINTTNRVTVHDVPGLNEEMSPVVSQKERSVGYRTHTSEKKETDRVQSKLGEYFKDTMVYRLRHDEGDMVLEGRSGQSIRFGAAWKSNTMFQSSKTDQSPNLLMRVGPDPTQIPTSKFGLVREDINKDASSIYLVSDQIIPLAYATKGMNAHGVSIHDFPNKLDGNQIVINSDRFVINAKKTSIMGFALQGIHWTSGKDFTVDVESNYESFIKKNEIKKIDGNATVTIGQVSEQTAGDRISLMSSKVYVGLKQNDSEPIPCGATLSEFLQRFLDAFITNASGIALITASPGNPSPLNPKIIAALNQLKSDVVKGADASFNSTIAFTTK